MSCVAPLFVPADRPERFGKAAACGADAVIVDLEDAVAASAKDSARANLAHVAVPVPVIVRVNAIGTAWHEADVSAALAISPAAIMVPKCEDVDQLYALAAPVPIIALVETALGLDRARAIARSGLVSRLAFGSVDYAADLGCAHVPDALASARAEIVLASRLGGLPAPLDGVTTVFNDGMQAVSDDAIRARALGFGGKMAIHPNQIEPILSAFRPSEDEISWARKVLAASDGVSVIEGQMIDAPVRLRAQHIMSVLRSIR
jgi:citrate lyase subunit beta/citryl-CoA lyase